MSAINTDPGLITRVEDGHMYVKVPVGHGCRTCPGKMTCTFSGPDRAYRTFRVALQEGCRVGDRVLVHVPGSLLGLTALVLIGLPVLLIFGGYLLLGCCIRFPFATPVLWLLGIGIWLAAMYGANQWVERGVMFHERVETIGKRRR